MYFELSLQLKKNSMSCLILVGASTNIGYAFTFFLLIDCLDLVAWIEWSRMTDLSQIVGLINQIHHKRHSSICID